MKKNLLLLFVLCLSLQSTAVFAQRSAIFYPIFIPSSSNRCCDCKCDTAKVNYKPINHWNDVRHVIYTGFSPVNTMNISMLSSNAEQNDVEMSLVNNSVNWQTIGYEYIRNRSFVGMDMGINFGAPSQALSPQLNIKMTNMVNLGINVGHHLLTTQNLRLYVMGKLQMNYVNMRLQRKIDDIPQKSWNRFIGSQNDILPYDRLVEGLLTTDRWGDNLDISSAFFATQLRIGFDYRINKVKLGLHTGYSYQLSEKSKNWNYRYEFEEGDERKHFKVTNAPISVSLNGLNVGFSIGYLLSDVVK
jgi:hypothetical protein